MIFKSKLLNMSLVLDMFQGPFLFSIQLGYDQVSNAMKQVGRDLMMPMMLARVPFFYLEALRRPSNLSNHVGRRSQSEAFTKALAAHQNARSVHQK